MKVPDTAERVFKGLHYDIYHWPRVEENGVSRVIEMIKRKSSVLVLAIKDNKIYIGEERDLDRSFYTLFAGSREEGEKPLEAAKRELKEEAGFASDDWELFHHEDHKYFKIDWDIYTFIARDCKDLGSQELEEIEDISVKSYTFDEFMQIILREDFRNSELSRRILILKEQGKLAWFKEKLGIRE